MILALCALLAAGPLTPKVPSSFAGAGTAVASPTGAAAKATAASPARDSAKVAQVSKPDSGVSRAVKAENVDPAVATPAPEARDTTQSNQLPPRALPMKQQLMFAGGFMVFLALMLTSLQNFNPND